MRLFKIIGIIAVLLLVSVFTFSCKLEHSYFDFVLEDFAELREEEYTTSTELQDYTIDDLIIRPWIKESPHNVYGIGIYGYTDKQSQKIEIHINSLTLYSKNDVELISISDSNAVFQCLEKDSYTCFAANNVCSFSGDVDTVKDYEVLYLDLDVSVTNGESVETKELKYKIDIVEYLSTFMIT